VKIQSDSSECRESKSLILVNSSILNNLQIWRGIYQSVLTSIPVKRGQLFSRTYQPVGKPKLGNTIKQLHLIFDISNFILTSIEGLEDLSGGVGFRLKASNMKLDIKLNHNEIKSFTSDDGKLKKKSVTKWSADSMLVELTDLETRALTYDLNRSANTKMDEDDEKTWLFEQDLNFVDNYNQMNLLPFLWTPCVSYYYYPLSSLSVKDRVRDRNSSKNVLNKELIRSN
jgi:hypothetical protein